MTHKIVFIGGLQRSGTTLLFRCLRNHPNISGFHGTKVPMDEGQFLQTVYSLDSAHGGPGRFGFDPTAYLNEKNPLVSSDNARQLFLEWASYWDLKKSILLEKTPINLIRTRFLQALFPNSLFIIINRHPVAVTYATKRIWKGSVHSLLEHWLICHEQFEKDKTFLHNYHHISYEELVFEPVKHLKNIFTFLDLDNIPLHENIRTELNNKYFALWKKDCQKGHTQTYINFPYLIDRFEKRVKQFGYSLLIKERQNDGRNPYPRYMFS